MTDLGAAARRLLARWWLVGAGAALGLLGGTAWLAVTGLPSVSCTTVEVEPVLAEEVSAAAPVRRFVLMDNELAVGESQDVRAIATEQAGFPVRQAALSASVPANTEVVRFCYRDRSGSRAQDGAQAIGTAYRLVRAEAVAEDLRTRTAAATAELARLRADLEAAAPTDPTEDLSDRIEVLQDRLLLLRAVDDDGSRVLQEAQPARLDTGHRRAVLVAGLGLGLLVGCAAALRLPHEDRRRP